MKWRETVLSRTSRHTNYFLSLNRRICVCEAHYAVFRGCVGVHLNNRAWISACTRVESSRIHEL
jgi:hypothetical protein